MQNQIIQSDCLKVVIKPMGAELCGLLDKRDGIEHMWRADPKFWPRQAPVLFPTIGESKNGVINVDGTEYPMGRHGFARQEEFKVVSKSEEKVTFELTSNETTRKHFPFEFIFRISYRLEESKLTQHFFVKNTGDADLGFQLGGHPAFAVPFAKGESYHDYEVRFDSPQNLERHLLTDNGLYSGVTRSFLNNKDRFGLSYELFKEDALVFKDIVSKQVWIQQRSGGKHLQMDFKGFPHFGIWSVPGADYVCLEPWIGCADMVDQPKGYFDKDNLVLLSNEQFYEAEFSISVC